MRDLESSMNRENRDVRSSSPEMILKESVSRVCISTVVRIGISVNINLGRRLGDRQERLGIPST